MDGKIELHANIDAVGAIDPAGEVHVFGNAKGRYPFASVTKLLTTHVIADLVASGFVSFDDWINDDYFQKGQVCLADLLSHSSGVRPDGQDCYTPHQKRIYTNEAFEMAGDFILARLAKDFKDVTFSKLFNDGLGIHLESSILLEGSCAASAIGTFDDLMLFAREIREPTFLDLEMHSKLITPYLPDLSGILPGWGNFEKNVFGIGYEIKGEKLPHTTGTFSSSSTYGHFGQSGTFVFHDPENMLTTFCVTNHDFGPWAKEEYPKLSDQLFNSFVK